METRTLEEVLAGTTEILFPEEGGGKTVTIETRGTDGDSPLHVAAWQNDIEGAKLLIAAGSDVNAVGDMAYTPLHVAISQNNAELAKIFINAGARSDLTSELGGTAREEALRRGGKLAALFSVAGA
jgi:ankyrin repeat protein